VTGHDDGEAVACAERAGCALGARMTGEPREVGVRDDLAVRNAPQRAEHVELERCPALDVDLDVAKVSLGAFKVRPEPVGELFRFRLRSTSDTCAFRR
jgi:hypothetical protein